MLATALERKAEMTSFRRGPICLSVMCFLGGVSSCIAELLCRDRGSRAGSLPTGPVQLRQKSLNRSGASSVKRTVCRL